MLLQDSGVYYFLKPNFVDCINNTCSLVDTENEEIKLN